MIDPSTDGTCREPSMKSLLILEHSASGHRMNYVRLIAREAIKKTITVTVATLPESTRHPAFLMMKEELGDRIETRLLYASSSVQRQINSGNLIIRQLGCRKLFAMNVNKLKNYETPEMVLLPFLEHCDKAIAALGSPFGDLSFSGIVMKSRFHHQSMAIRSPSSKMDWIKEKLFLKLVGIRTLKALFTIDEPLTEYIAQTRPQLGLKLHTIPDPVDFAYGPSRSQARKTFGIPEKAVVLLCYGALSDRKGVAPLLNALQYCQSSHLTLFMAGEQDLQVRETLQSSIACGLRSQGRLIERNLYHVGADETAVFRASDMVWVGYQNFYGPSAVAVQAGAMGLPILASQDGLIGWMAKKYELGPIIDIRQAREVANTMDKLIRDEEAQARYGTNGIKLALQHTGENFGRRICDTLFDREIKAAAVVKELETTFP